jgi:hypothetical protein
LTGAGQTINFNLGTTATSFTMVGGGGSNQLVVQGSPPGPLTVQQIALMLNASGINVSATAGAPLTRVPVATFTDPEADSNAGQFTATLDWGDGSPPDTTSTLITGSAGNYTVYGSHTYADPRGYTIDVQIGNAGSTATGMASSTATVTSLGLGVQKGLTATIGFWHNQNGQDLIQNFGVTATGLSLGGWLAKTFPFMYGVNAGSNDLTLASNSDVAAFYLSQFNLPGPKVEAQVLAAALDVYATTASLGGGAGAAYGFTVSATGLGARSFNVGADGSAVGVANNGTLNVYELLLAVNQRAVNGMLYNGDKTLRQNAADLFASLDQAGDIG